MQLRAAWCASLTPPSALATSTLSSKKTASPAPNCPPCLHCLRSSLTSPSSCPPFLLSYGKSSPPSDSLRSPETSPRLWLSFCLKAQRVRSPPACPASPRVFQTSRRSFPSFPAGASSSLLASRTALAALCHKMPKRQQQQRQQQKQRHDEKRQGVELNQLVRHSPFPSHHRPPLCSRSPSPSSPLGSSLELPNVPSYPRLPPIVSPPSKQLSSLSRQLSGLSNPAFFIEDDSAVGPAGDSLGDCHCAYWGNR